MGNYNANKVNSVRDVSTGTKRNRYDSSLNDSTHTRLSGNRTDNTNTGKATTGMAGFNSDMADLGINNTSGFQGTVSNNGGAVDFKGNMSREALQNAANNGVFKGEALKGADNLLKSDKSEFQVNATGSNGHITSLITGNTQSASLKSDGINNNKYTSDTGNVAKTNYTAEQTAQLNKNPKLAGKLLSKGLGINSINGKDGSGTVTESAGVTNFKGMINRKGLSSLIAGKKLKRKALTEANQALKSGKPEFYMDAQGANGHITKMGIGNEQNVAMVTNGQQGNILTTKIGTDIQKGNFAKLGNYQQIYHDATSTQFGATATGSVIMQAAKGGNGSKRAFSELQSLSKGHPNLKVAIAKDYAQDITSFGQKAVTSAKSDKTGKVAAQKTSLSHKTTAGWEAKLNLGVGIVTGAAAAGAADFFTGGAGIPADGLIYGGTIAGVDYGLNAIEGNLSGGVSYKQNTSFDRSHSTGTNSASGKSSGTSISKNATYTGAYNDFMAGTPYSLPSPKSVSLPKGTFKPINNPLSIGGIVGKGSQDILHGVGIDPMNNINGAYSGQYIPPSPAGGAAVSQGSLPSLQGGGTPQLQYSPQIGYEAGESAGPLLLP
ncbi:MAG: hypothetical protein ACYCTB_09700 [bacterium]